MTNIRESGLLVSLCKCLLGLIILFSIGCQNSGDRFESGRLIVGFDAKTGDINCLTDKQSGAILKLRSKESFILQIDPLSSSEGVSRSLIDKEPEIILRSTDCKLVNSSLETNKESGDQIYTMSYQSEWGEIEVNYSLGIHDHFLQKTIEFKPSFDKAYLVRKIIGQEFEFSEIPGKLIPFRHGACITHFIRNKESGFFCGIQSLYANPDTLQLNKEGSNSLDYVANMRIEKQGSLKTEPVFWGCYQPTGILSPKVEKNHKSVVHSQIPPDKGEVDAMMDMACKLLPQDTERDILVLVNGWASGRADLNSQEILSNCQNMFESFYFTGSSTWGGLVNEVAALTPEDQYLPNSPNLESKLTWASNHGTNYILWTTLLAPHPWRKVYRYCPDYEPWWLIGPKKEPGFMKHGPEGSRWNCAASKEYMNWHTQLAINEIKKYDYPGWAHDEGLGRRADLSCTAENHDHLPGGAGYTYWTERRRLIKKLRNEFGSEFYIGCYRPQQDMGIWDWNELNSIFTLNEDLPEHAGGDLLRRWSRIRHDYHFCPSYLDNVLIDLRKINIGIDFYMLSALAVSSNYIFYLGDNPPQDVQDRVKYWTQWARENGKVMRNQVIFLSDWPETDGKCDGYLRINKGSGFAFLFNPYDTASTIQLALDETVGLQESKEYQVKCIYPESGITIPNNSVIQKQETIMLPAQTAVLLEIKAAE